MLAWLAETISYLLCLLLILLSLAERVKSTKLGIDTTGEYCSFLEGDNTADGTIRRYGGVL